MILLANVYVDVLRSFYSAIGGTDIAQPYLEHVEAHIGRVKESNLMMLGASAMYAMYDLYTEPTVDIRKGDIITNIIRKDNDQKWFVQTDMETWRVLQSNTSPPPFFEYRDITLGRYVAGGPVQSE